MSEEWNVYIRYERGIMFAEIYITENNTYTKIYKGKISLPNKGSDLANNISEHRQASTAITKRSETIKKAIGWMLGINQGKIKKVITVRQRGINQLNLVKKMKIGEMLVCKK